MAISQLSRNMKSHPAIMLFKVNRSCVSAFLAVVLNLWPRHSLSAHAAAVATSDFLNSIGVVTTFPDRGQPLAKTIEMIRYCGFRQGAHFDPDLPRSTSRNRRATELGIGQWWG